MGSFSENLTRIGAEIGERTSIVVEVNQVYAHYQEVHPEFRHPQGGQAFYLRDSVVARSTRWMEMLAEHAISHDGTDWRQGSISVSEHVVQSVWELAPVEWSDLRSSGHPTVSIDGEVIYDRGPLVHRLSAEELKAKHKMQETFEPLRYAYEPSQIKWATDPAYKWGAILRDEGKKP